MRKYLGVMALISLALTSTAWADSFVNGGFESGDLSSWTESHGTISTGDPRVLTPGGTGGRTAAVSVNETDATNKISNGLDTNTNSDLNVVYNGTYAARVNNYANGAHYSSLEQTVTNYASNNIYFAWAAVLLDPSNTPHTAFETPYFQVKLTDVTSGSVLYDISFDSTYNLPPFAFHNGATVNGDPNNNNGTWKYTYWNPVSIDVSSRQGDTFQLSVLAADCTLGGHGGYAYVDAFNDTILPSNPGIKTNSMTELGSGSPEVPEPATMLLFGSGLASAGFFRRRRAAGKPVKDQKKTPTV